MCDLKVYKKANNKYIETYSTTDPGEIYKRLCDTFIAKKLNCCKWVRSIKREPLYNGYQKIIVQQTENIQEIYIIKN